MRTTVTIDDKLLADAKKFTGVSETPTLVRIALEALVQREAARRLARLGGTDPEATATASSSMAGRVILVDSSVWIDHFRENDAILLEMLEEGIVSCHPFVVAKS